MGYHLSDLTASTCYWCGCAVVDSAGRRKPRRIRDRKRTKDHLHDDVNTIVIACRLCNSSRGRATNWVPFAQIDSQTPPALQVRSLVRTWGDGWRSKDRRRQLQLAQ